MSPEAKRSKSGMVAAKKLEAAATALNAYIHACNDCNDASADLGRQGKGIDGRRKLIADMAEYSGYLDSLFSQEGQR